MKRLIPIFLVFALLSSLCGCNSSGSSAEPSPIPAAPAPSSSAENLPEDLFVLTMEHERLYLSPLRGGEAILFADSTCTAWGRRGNILYAAFDDGHVLKGDLSTGQTREVVAPGGPTMSRIQCFDGGFTGQSFSMTETKTYVFREDTGKLEKTDFSEYGFDLQTAGDKAACIGYRDDDLQLDIWDLKTMELCWSEVIPGSMSLYSFNDTFYLFSWGGSKLCRVDTEEKKICDIELPLSETDSNLIYYWNDKALIQGNYQDSDNYYLVSSSGRNLVPKPGTAYLSLVDATENHLLFLDWNYQQSDKVEGWYYQDRYYTFDMDSGVMTEVSLRGEYSRLFERGDFPVMDSSTARKPVTGQIYSFFCESTGVGGTVPLCSTTHGAWLNIADGKVDIALLAAPTDEEQVYLSEKGVSVDMKLYGGDGLVFIGNKACGVSDLTLEQVRGIYRGDITNWAQLGGVDHPIRVLYRDDQSGSQRLFERLLWKDESVPDLEKQGFERLDEMSTIVSECLYDPYTVGYSIMTYLHDVYGTEDLLSFSLEGYAATPKNVKAGLYPLSTSGYVVIRSDEPSDSPARRLYNWFGSPLCDTILTMNGITPLHD